MGPIAIVIPAFNEAATIRDVVSGALRAADHVIVVDDGSTDGTADRIADLDIHLIRHPHNRRKAASLWAGMQAALAAGADAVVTMDGDGQHRPDDIPKLVHAACAHPNQLIIGARLHQRNAIPGARYRANRFASFWISWAAGYRIDDSQSGFRLYPAALLRDIDIATGATRGFAFESEILIEAAARGVQSIAIDIPALYPPEARASHFRPVADIAAITTMVAGHLLRRGLHLPGLYHAWIAPAVRRRVPPGFDRDALVALLISLLFGVSTLGVPYLWLLWRVHRRALTANTGAGDAEGVVVLGHRLEDGQPSADYRCRLERARAILSSRPGVTILLAGGRVERGRTESAAGREYLQSAGADAQRLHCEDLSANSVENIERIRPWLQRYRRVAFISNRYHLERIVTIARGMGLELQPCAAEETCRTFFDVFPRSLVEAFYLHWYWSGRIFGRLTSNTRMLAKIGMQSGMATPRLAAGGTNGKQHDSTAGNAGRCHDSAGECGAGGDIDRPAPHRVGL